MPDLRVAVIVDRGRAQVFGVDALDSLGGCTGITVFSCQNTRLRRKPIKHAAYYALNLLAVRNSATRFVPITDTKKQIRETVEFESGYEGAWQTLPPEIVARLAGFDVIVKMGMGLLRVPPSEMLAAPMLSWHHGDPDEYRGRPAGFWEIFHGKPAMGQVIQVLSNTLDGGQVVAFAETKVRPYSYRRTLVEAYRHSHLLLNQAVRNALAGKALPKASAGRNYRLPSNVTVLQFVLQMVLNWGKRLLYGAFIEKRWHVSTAKLPPEGAAGIAAGATFPSPNAWATLPTPREYVFLADPFFSCDPKGILVEGLNRRTGLGEIALVTTDSHVRVSNGGVHLSYPSTLIVDGRQIILPEMTQAAGQRCFQLLGGKMEEAGAITVEGSPRLVDPTLLEHAGLFYLFANDATLGSSALNLWFADSPHGPFRLHACSPVKISPFGGRMAGAILKIGEQLIRFGQGFREEYGDGVFAFEVEKLSSERYSERLIGSISFQGLKGPHTINFQGDQMVFDWYTSQVAIFAGLRRLAGRFPK